MDLLMFNPWWREGKISKALVGRRRRMLREVLSYLDLRQILIFSGLRRVGKTTLMFQIIDELLTNKKTDPYHILYFSFDEAKSALEDILSEYEKAILKDSISKKERIYIFFDEIQKLEGWPEKVKVVYDLHPNVKMFLSGSAALNIKRGTRESLAGRFFDFDMGPLDLDEYLEFRGVKIDTEREDIFELQIRQSLDHFLSMGGFIEALNFDEIQRNRYFREGLLERVIYRDLPDVFPVSSPDLLYKLIRLCAEKPGLYLDYKNIGNDLDHDQRTIANYFSYLEYAMLVKKLFNYSPNMLTSEKKIKRVYLSNTAFTLALSAKTEQSLLIEQFFVNLFRSKFFSRTPQRDEVDFVITVKDRVIPVEVKIKSDVKRGEAKSLFKFMTKHKLKNGYIISGKTLTSFSDGNLQVEVIPYWKYWSIKNKIGVNTE